MERTIGTLHAQHQAAYRMRRKLGLTPFSKPWDWLSANEVKQLAMEAYLAATHDASDSDDQAPNPREFFVAQLTQAFEVLVAGKAQSLGIACAPSGSMHYATCLRERTPADWNPQYPVYKKIAPASVCTTPEAVTNADKDNVNEQDFRPQL